MVEERLAAQIDHFWPRYLLQGKDLLCNHPLEKGSKLPPPICLNGRKSIDYMILTRPQKMKSTIHSWLIWAKSYQCPENSPKLAPLGLLQTEKRVKTPDTKKEVHIWETLMKGGCKDCSLLPHNIVQKSAWNWGHFESCRQGIRSKGAQRPSWSVTWTDLQKSDERWGGVTKVNHAKQNVNVTGVHKKSGFTW